MRRQIWKISDTSPASASTDIGDVVRGLLPWEAFTVDAKIIGGTGGTIDVYLQRQVSIDDDVWADWLHLPQVAAATTAQFSLSFDFNGLIRTVGWGTAASAGTPALAANAFVGGHPGDAVRAVYTAGAGTSVGAAQVIYITGWR